MTKSEIRAKVQIALNLLDEANNVLAGLLSTLPDKEKSKALWDYVHETNDSIETVAEKICEEAGDIEEGDELVVPKITIYDAIVNVDIPVNDGALSSSAFPYGGFPATSDIPTLASYYTQDHSQRCLSFIEMEKPDEVKISEFDDFSTEEPSGQKIYKLSDIKKAMV